MNVIRIGVLGAARIAPAAVMNPAQLLGQEVRIEAVAARDPDRARAFARRWGIPRALGSYPELVEDAGIDAVYNPLPNSLHAAWTIRALKAGKHVLCEKPMGCNAREAEEMNAAAGKTGRVLMEGFHYRHHPLAQRMGKIVAGGELGELQHVEAHFCAALWRFGDIRYRYDLGGGATMDLGCYCINLIRFLVGAGAHLGTAPLGSNEPLSLTLSPLRGGRGSETCLGPEVVGARARLASAEVDRYMEADFRFANGVTARMTCSLWSRVLLRAWALVRGSKGEMRVRLPFQPHHFLCRLEVRSGGGTRVERVSREMTYNYQLRTFAAAVRGEGPVVTTGADAVANMRVIDAVYTKAGLKPRGT